MCAMLSRIPQGIPCWFSVQAKCSSRCCHTHKLSKDLSDFLTIVVTKYPLWSAQRKLCKLQRGFFSVRLKTCVLISRGYYFFVRTKLFTRTLVCNATLRSTLHYGNCFLCSLVYESCRTMQSFLFLQFWSTFLFQDEMIWGGASVM